MTLAHANVTRMLGLGFAGMAEALRDQQDVPDIETLAFDDRLALLLEREAAERDNRSYLAHLRRAQLRVRATIEDVDCSAGRGLSRTTLTQLAAGNWIRRSINLTVTGKTGAGKTFLACALAHQACRQRRPTLYRRVSDLLAELDQARCNGRYDKCLRTLVKCDLLVLDDWGMQVVSGVARQDLFEVVERRYAVGSTLIASQIPREHWHETIDDPTLADAILDRLMHNAVHIALEGESMRKRPAPVDLADLGGPD